MTKTFLIGGSIVDTDQEKETFEDVTPSQISMFLKGLDEGDDVVFEFNSCGGSCTAGITIGNLIKKASSQGHHTTARVVGLCASIASYIACCCDDLEICSNAFLMIHLPWTCIQGNKRDLETEIKNLQLFEEALVSVYKTKFDLSDDDIKKMLDAETWILGQDAKSYSLKCNIIYVDSELKIAAKYQKTIKNFKNFNTNSFSDMEKEEIVENKVEETVEEKTTDTVEEVKSEVVEEVEEVTEEKTEEVTEETTEETTDTDDTNEVEELKKMIEELKTENEELKNKLEEKTTDENVEARISKCQSTFQNKINGFKAEIELKDKELQELNDSVSSLTTELENTQKELHKMSAAFEEKSSTLASLTAGVLATPTENTVDWRTLRGQEFFDYIKKNPQILNK